jgi:hypothetical protein
MSSLPSTTWKKEIVRSPLPRKVRSRVADKAIVIYDLTKMPPIVKTANDTFCKMLGYELVRSLCVRCLPVSRLEV